MKKLIIINHGRLNKEEMSSCKGGTSVLNIGSISTGIKPCNDVGVYLVPNCITAYAVCTRDDWYMYSCNDTKMYDVVACKDYVGKFRYDCSKYVAPQK
jgi:hypothetical protein